MGLPEPTSRLWAAVKAVDSTLWPLDDEVVAADVGAAWLRGDGIVDSGVLDAGHIGTDLGLLWGGDSGPAFQAKLAEYTTTAGAVREQIRTLEKIGRNYANELISAKNTIIDTINRNEEAYARLANPMLGELGPALQSSFVTQVANDLRSMIAEKAAALRANPTGAPPPPPPPPPPAGDSGFWGELAHGALDLVGLVPVVGELADGVNAAWYAAEGRYVEAGLSAAAMIPGAGIAATAAKYGKKAVDAASALRPADELAGATAARAPDARTTVGDPIDVASGEMVLHQVDLELPGVLPLVLTRTHVSSYRAGVSFGPSWASTVDQRLEFDGAGVVFVADEGVVLVYPPVPAGVPVLPEFGPRWPLRRDDAGYVVDKPEQGLHLEFTPADPGPARLTAIADRNGNRVELARDARGTPREVRHSGGYHVVFDSAGGLVTGMRLLATDTSISLTGYRYDDARRLVEVVNSSGRPLRFDYDPAGRITRWEDRNGQWYSYDYDDRGRCVRNDGSGGFLAGRFAYTDRRTVYTDALGARTTYDLNERGQVVRETDPLGNATLSERDRYDRLLSRTDPIGRTTSYTYDDDGNLSTVVAPDGTAVTATYHAPRLPVTITDADGARWRRAYDERGNLTSVTDPTGARSEYRYTTGGRLASVTDPLGHTWRVATNAAGLPVAVTDALGAGTSYVRDVFGRVVRVVDPAGGVTRSRWTVEGRLLSRTLPNGATERWRYDGEGNPIEHVDAIGQVTRTEYTGFNLPAARTGPDGTRYEFGYDAGLRLVSVTNPHGLVWRYHYDPAGRLRSETDFNGRTVAYAHDPAGQLVERTNGAGERVRFGRDALGRVREKHVAGVLTTFAYDAVGRLVRATNPDADVTFRRDALGRVLAESVNGRTVSSAYDRAGRRVRVTTPSGAESNWDYDAGGRVVALHTAGHTMRFDHDPAGREVRRTLGGDVVLAQAWDLSNRLASQVLTATDRVVQRRAYEYRLDGHVVGIHDQLAGSRRFELDPAGRVTAVRGTGWTERYAYDSAGNMTAADWPSAGGDGQGDREYAGTLIIRGGRTHFQHDAQGRVVLRRRRTLSGQIRDWHYSWSADDRLTGVTTPDGTRWVYAYDPLGRRIAKQRVDGDHAVEQVDFTWDGTVLAEQTHTRVRGDGVAVRSSTTWEWLPGTGQPVSQTERGVRDAPQQWIDEQFYAIVTDLVGTPTELIDTNGGVAWCARTTTWGVPIAGGTGHAYCPLRFPGQYHDIETGQNYNHHRYYDADTARYHSADPLGLAPAPDPHQYVGNPLLMTDPLGLSPGADSPMLYRGMRPGADSLPEVGPSARTLGARPGTDIPVNGGRVDPETGGMSVSPDSPHNLPPHRRPAEFGGNGRDPVFGVGAGDLPSGLRYRPDPGNPSGHGFIEPSRSMTVDEYQELLAGTRPLWQRANP